MSYLASSFFSPQPDLWLCTGQSPGHHIMIRIDQHLSRGWMDCQRCKLLLRAITFKIFFGKVCFMSSSTAIPWSLQCHGRTSLVEMQRPGWDDTNEHLARLDFFSPNFSKGDVVNPMCKLRKSIQTRRLTN